jgi:hypothetical protein
MIGYHVGCFLRLVVGCASQALSCYSAIVRKYPDLAITEYARLNRALMLYQTGRVSQAILELDDEEVSLRGYAEVRCCIMQCPRGAAQCMSARISRHAGERCLGKNAVVLAAAGKMCWQEGARVAVGSWLRCTRRWRRCCTWSGPTRYLARSNSGTWPLSLISDTPTWHGWRGRSTGRRGCWTPCLAFLHCSRRFQTALPSLGSNRCMRPEITLDLEELIGHTPAAESAGPRIVCLL